MLPFNASIKDVTDLARDLQATWGKQRRIDDAMLDLYRQRHVVSISDPDQAKTSKQGDINKDISPIGMGKAPQIVDQWAALMGGRLRPHVSPLGNSPTAQGHADKLEEFSEGSFLRMEQRMGAQWPKIRKDIALYGRGVGVVLPAPQFWSPKGNPDFRRRKDESKIEWLDRINNLKKGVFPITFTKLDARSTYFRFGEFSDDVVRIRQLKAGEIIKRFPRDAVQLQDRINRRDITYNSSVDVIDYFSDEWFGMFAGNDVLKRKRHFMGMLPVVLFGGNPMPDNKEQEWYGILYHARHLIPAYDELVSNILTNVRRDTRALTVIEHDPEIEGTGAEVSGRPKQELLIPGGQKDIWKGEKIYRLGSAASNVDYGVLLPEIGGGLGDFLREIFMGQARSDTTGTAVRLIAELANILQNDTIEGIRAGGKGLFVRIFHAVSALQKQDKKSDPDKVYVRVEDTKRGSREIAVSAEDVQGYDDLIQVRYGLQTPTDQRATGDFVRLMTEDRPGTGPVFDMTTGREMAGQENPQDIEDRVWRQRVVNSPEFITKVVALASEAFEGVREADKQAVTPEQMQLLQQILTPEQLEILLGGNGAAPAQQGATTNVPLANTMGAGEQETVQEPR